jgi:hypothetical protein
MDFGIRRGGKLEDLFGERRALISSPAQPELRDAIAPKMQIWGGVNRGMKWDAYLVSPEGSPLEFAATIAGAIATPIRAIAINRLCI